MYFPFNTLLKPFVAHVPNNCNDILTIVTFALIIEFAVNAMTVNAQQTQGNPTTNGAGWLQFFNLICAVAGDF